jgi:UDP-N-acetyl-D-mannosaminuronate dehydrogenase
MIDIQLTGTRIDTILGIVRELRQAGLVQGQDFDFAYSPERLDYNLATVGEVLARRHTVFSFYDESLASWFGIKYADYLA